MNVFCFLTKTKLASRTVGAASELRGRIWTPTHSSVARGNNGRGFLTLKFIFKIKSPKEKCL